MKGTRKLPILNTGYDIGHVPGIVGVPEKYDLVFQAALPCVIQEARQRSPREQPVELDPLPIQ
jgi:hypothetical protein